MAEAAGGTAEAARAGSAKAAVRVAGGGPGNAGAVASFGGVNGIGGKPRCS